MRSFKSVLSPKFPASSGGASVFIIEVVFAEIIIRYLHFVSILALVAAVVAQHWGLRATLTRGEIYRLQRMDIVYAVSVELLLLLAMPLLATLMARGIGFSPEQAG